MEGNWEMPGLGHEWFGGSLIGWVGKESPGYQLGCKGADPLFSVSKQLLL